MSSRERAFVPNSTSSPARVSQSPTKLAISCSPGPAGTRSGFTELIDTSSASSRVTASRSISAASSIKRELFLSDR